MSEEWKEGDLVPNLNTGKEVPLIKLGNGMLGYPHQQKCHVKGCRVRKNGYLTQGCGGGGFYNRRGKFLADLRNQDFNCGKHEDDEK